MPRSSRYINISGLILRKKNIGENDYLLTILSPEIGKFQASSRSSRKITSTKGSHLDSLNHVNLQLYQKNNSYTIIQCQSDHSFLDLKSDLSKTLIAQAMAEIMLLSLDGIEDSADQYNLLIESFQELDKSANLLLHLEQFKIKLLQNLGLLPDLKNCSSCHQLWPDQNEILLSKKFFLICRNCADKNHHDNHETISFGILKLLFHLSIQPYNFQNFTLRAGELEKIQNLSSHLLAHHFHQEIKSEKLLRTI